MAIGNINLIAEESYYWNYANHLDFSYFDHPPMVAYLIKISTLIFGINEFAVRFPAILCWLITGYYTYKLTEKIYDGSGIYAFFLLSFLPFFFIQSVIMTPDLPLMATWSGSLYYLYQALIDNKNKYWVKLGLCFGLGLISKYTIILLVPATLILMLINRNLLKKLLTPYPYITCIISLLIFTPVIYWNAKHDWASFAFQSTQRFKSGYEFSLHEILGLLILFLTPIGIISSINIFKAKVNTSIAKDSKRFLQVYTLFPLVFFMLFSIFHTTKFNWIGPGLLAIIPWLAIESKNFNKIWRMTAIFLLVTYTSIILCISSGKPTNIYVKFFQKFNNWDDFYYKIKNIANNSSAKYKKPIIIIPLDKYNLASQLNFYQAKHKGHDLIIYARNVFGQDALMYNYWYPKVNTSGKNLLIIHEDRYMFNADFIANNASAITPVKSFFSISQGSGTKARKYLYQILEPKSTQP